MTLMQIVKKVTITGLLCAASAVNASTIDFEGAVPNDGVLGHNATPYTQSGYTLNSSISVGYTNDIVGPESGFNTDGTAVFGWCGARCGGDITLTMAGSTPFSVTSIDFGSLNLKESGSLTLTGFITDGSLVTESLSIGDIWKTYNFSGFNNLRLLQLKITSDFTAGMDNIAVTSNAVPEPGSMALLAIGAAMFGYSSRRRKAA